MSALSSSVGLMDNSGRDSGDVGSESPAHGAHESHDSTAHNDSLALFSCRLESAKELHALLTCLIGTSKKRDQYAQCHVSDSGLSFVTTQMSGTLPRRVFSSFECAEEEGGNFCLNLGVILDCLGIFGPMALTNTSLTMAFHPGDSTFRITMEEHGVFTTCDVQTIDTGADDSSKFTFLASEFRAQGQACKLIIKSEFLKEALYELQDLSGATSVHILISPTAPHFQLAASGNIGTLEIEFPKSSELFMLFECTETQQWTYRLDALLQGMRALVVASETFLRINVEGIMCIQHQVQTSSGDTSFVDFLMSPNVLDDDSSMSQASQAIQSAS